MPACTVQTKPRIPAAAAEVPTMMPPSDEIAAGTVPYHAPESVLMGTIPPAAVQRNKRALLDDPEVPTTTLAESVHSRARAPVSAASRPISVHAPARQ